MNISVIASGSNGNSCLVEDSGTTILFDAGLSGRRLEERLNSLEKTLADVNGIVISHAHTDHMKSAGVIGRRYGLPLFITKEVHQNIGTRFDLTNVSIKEFSPNEPFKIGSLVVQPVKTSHDVPSSGFVVNGFGIFTDTGKATSEMKQVLPSLTAVLIESNYDTEMLANGPYPYFLKKRIKSNNGHLCNVDAGHFIESFGEKLRLVLLGHLSGENNSREVAAKTFESTVTRDVEYHVCSREEVTGTWEI